MITRDEDGIHHTIAPIGEKKLQKMMRHLTRTQARHNPRADKFLFVATHKGRKYVHTYSDADTRRHMGY